MRFARRTTPPRHLAGAEREPWVPHDADFDVAAAFEPDFDFDALFAADDEPAEEPDKARLSPRRVAVALSVTLAALPLLFLDNFQATASQSSKVDASALHDASSSTAPTVLPQRLPTTEAAQTTMAPLPQAVVFQADPTTTTEQPTTTTEAPTTTAAAPTFVAASKPPVIVTTTTTAPPPPPPTTTTVAPAPKAVAAPTSGAPDPDAESTWDRLARCESGGNWAANTGNGYYGGLQFSLATWRNLGGEGYPNEASKSTQIAMGKKLYARSGWDAWPSCARKLGWT